MKKPNAVQASRNGKQDIWKQRERKTLLRVKKSCKIVDSMFLYNVGIHLQD